MEADTKPVPFLYRSPLPGTAGIDRYKMVLIQYRICTVMFTGREMFIITWYYIASQLQMQEKDKPMNSQRTLHSLPVRASYGVSLWVFLINIIYIYFQ